MFQTDPTVRARPVRTRRARHCALTLVLLGIGPGLTASAAAQGNPSAADTGVVTHLAPVTVTGTRSRAVAPPVSTVEVGQAEIVRAPATTSYDLVRRAAGIEVHEQGQGPGFASDAVIRGFTSDHSSDVLLVVDGVPINLPLHGHVEGYADWSLLSPATVTSLRVIHGPASPFYGDFALGGVVEVTTASDAARRSGALGGSSYGDLNGWVRTGTQSDRGGGALALEGRREQGWRDNAAYWLGNAAARGWRRAGAGRLEGGVLLYGSSWDSPGFVSVSRYNRDDLVAANDPTDGGAAGRLILQGRYTRPLGEALALDAMTWAQAVRSRVFLGVPEDGELSQTEEEDRRIAVGGQSQLTWHRQSGELDAGVSGRADWTRYDLYPTDSRTRTGEEQGEDGHFLSGAGFVRWRDLLGSRIVYDVGGRVDLLHYASRDRLDSSAGWRSATPVVASPKLGLRYLLGGRVELLGSISRGFRGAVGVIQDPSRPPVVAWAKEVGALYDDGQLHAQLAFFHLAVSRERIQDPVTREISEAGTSTRRGISLDASLAVGKRFSLVAEGTFNDAKTTGATVESESVRGPVPEPDRAGPLRGPSFHEVPLSPGERVPGVARFFGRAGAELRLTPQIDTRALFRFTGPYRPIGEPTVRTQAYGVFDLGGSLRLSPLGGVIDLDLLNLFDVRYPELRASGFVNPGAPRTLRAAVRFGEPS